MTWVPPRGSIEVEPGYWQAPNGDVYEAPDVDAGRIAANRARAQREHDRKVRDRPVVIEELRDRCERLEDRAYMRLVALEAATQLLEEQREQVVFLEGLVASLLVGARPSVRHLREAA